MRGVNMKNKISFMCIIPAIAIMVCAFALDQNKPKQEESNAAYAMEKQLAGISIGTNPPKPTEQPTEQPTESPTPKPTKKPEKLPPDLDIPLDYDVQRYIYKQCKKDDDFYCFIIAIIDQESGFDEKEVSYTNDYGLMQINACNHDDLQDKYGKKNFLDPYDNVYCGIRIIRGYLKEYEYKNLSLMVYNMGKYGARKQWRKGVYSTDYTVKVLDKYHKYLEQSEKEM